MKLGDKVEISIDNLNRANIIAHRDDRPLHNGFLRAKLDVGDRIELAECTVEVTEIGTTPRGKRVATAVVVAK